VRLLQDLGYTNVCHYPGGLAEWLEPEVIHRVAAPPEVRKTSIATAGFEGIRRPDLSAGWSSRFVDALGDRSVGSLFRWWIAMVLICGGVFWLLDWSPRLALVSGGRPVDTGVGGFLSALYFSAVTATSVGYGDIVPIGVARVIAIAESLAGLLLFGCVISKFVSRRQEQLIGEIHRIAFEDRLGRVRTNLLLVRTELQATAGLCEGREIAPPAALARVESAAMVFVGELHAVHDLLYRPQDAPEEAVLEAILAGLASVFREFNELLLCVQPQRANQSPALSTSIKVMSRLAREICGDCVPREFAPALRTWMDQIQTMAGEVEELGTRD
jgi:Ion channel